MRPKEIGQSPEYYLLYEILKTLNAILKSTIKVEVTNTSDNPVNVDQV